MRIAFCGAGGTGKTTVANLLKDELGLTFAPSVVRSVMEEWKVTEATLHKLSANQRAQLQYEIYARKEQHDREHKKKVIFDRTLADHYAYNLIYAGGVDLTPQFLRDIRDRAIEALKAYSVVIYAPIFEWDIGHDGFRNTNEVNRRLVDSIIHDCLFRSSIEFVTLRDESPAKRVEHILSWMRKGESQGE